MDASVDINSAEPVPPIGRPAAHGGGGGSGAAAPGDDLCPTWWPRRRRLARGTLHPGDGSLDVRAADRVYLALTLIASTFQYADEGMARDVCAVALANLADAAQALTRGAARPWAPQAEHVCPPWPPLPPAPDDGRAPDDAPPGRAAQLLDLLALLHAYSLAARIAADDARAGTTRAIGRALVEQAALVIASFR